MDLRDEPPALVNLLVNEVNLTGDAVAATILDLDVRRHLEIIQLSPDENLVVPHRNGDDALLPYEERLLQVVETAAAGGPHATIPAIAEALRPGSAETWLRFGAEVTRDARRRGLTASPATGRETKALMILSLLPCVGLLIAAPLAYIVTPFLFVGLLLSGVIAMIIGNTSVLTDAGRTAAGHWLGVKNFIDNHAVFEDLPPGAVAIWDRYLAYGAAMGISGHAVHGLVDQLRTTLTVGDVGGVVSAVGKAVHAQHDPVARRQWRAEQLRSCYGPDADPDAIYGPDQGDFWTLLENTGRTWNLASLTHRADRQIWQQATLARIDALAATAPSELSTDVATLAQAARHAVTVLTRSDDMAVKGLADDPAVTGAAVAAALDRVVKAGAARLKVDPTPKAFVESLVGSPLNLARLYG